MYYEFKMVDPALRKVHTETNQGEIFKVFEEENIFQFFSIFTCGMHNSTNLIKVFRLLFLLTKMRFLKEGQKIWAGVDPPPSFGQCLKENVFLIDAFPKLLIFSL